LLKEKKWFSAQIILKLMALGMNLKTWVSYEDHQNTACFYFAWNNLRHIVLRRLRNLAASPG
jgi:hypothetical protein